MTKCRMAVLQTCQGDLLDQLQNFLCHTDRSTYPFKAENKYLPLGNWSWAGFGAGVAAGRWECTSLWGSPGSWERADVNRPDALLEKASCVSTYMFAYQHILTGAERTGKSLLLELRSLHVGPVPR